MALLMTDTQSTEMPATYGIGPCSQPPICERQIKRCQQPTCRNCFLMTSVKSTRGAASLSAAHMAHTIVP